MSENQRKKAILFAKCNSAKIIFSGKIEERTWVFDFFKRRVHLVLETQLITPPALCVCDCLQLTSKWVTLII